MAKYYVQSGTLKLVVHADAADKAALWAVHRAMQQVLPVFDDEGLLPIEKHERVFEHGCLILGDEIMLSERGFDARPTATLDTYEVVTEWNQLMVALAKIERLAAKGQLASDEAPARRGAKDEATSAEPACTVA